MSEQGLRDIMSGRRRGAAASAWRASAWAASGPYALMMGLRRRMYRRGVFGSRAVGAPVISVGNLTTGGTGKTPMVAWLVGQLKKAGRDPAILTRGYKARAGRADEAEMLFKQTGVPVIVNSDRVSGGLSAVEAGADVLVMDDGFQHRRLKRDLDIVLIDATNPLGYGHVLPRGMLRERPSALRDADVIVITRCDLVSAGELEALRDRLGRLARRAEICLAGHVPTAVIAPAGRRAPASALAGKKVLAFCGIGNPDAFFETVARSGAEVVGRIAFDDHAAYGPPAAEKIASAAGEGGAEILVTTAKDRVKIEDPAALGAPLWTLEVAIGLTEGEALLIERVKKVLGP